MMRSGDCSSIVMYWGVGSNRTESGLNPWRYKRPSFPSLEGIKKDCQTDKNRAALLLSTTILSQDINTSVATLSRWSLKEGHFYIK